jgi:hypothetical protein
MNRRRFVASLFVAPLFSVGKPVAVEPATVEEYLTLDQFSARYLTSAAEAIAERMDFYSLQYPIKYTAFIES